MTPSTYRLRPATLDDVDALVRHRLAMFTEMGIAVHEATLAPAFREWLARLMPEGTYRAWLAETETGSFLVNEAAQLLAALRLWAQIQYRSDQVVREILEAVDAVVLERVADDLRAMGGRDARAASGTVTATIRLPGEQLMAIASYALRAV